LAERGQGWQGSKTQAYWLVVRVLLTPLEARKEKALTGLTPPAEAAASQKWKIIYLQVLRVFIVNRPTLFSVCVKIGEHLQWF